MFNILRTVFWTFCKVVPWFLFGSLGNPSCGGDTALPLMSPLLLCPCGEHVVEVTIGYSRGLERDFL